MEIDCVGSRARISFTIYCGLVVLFFAVVNNIKYILLSNIT